jgi:DNA-binding NarL/FixJ family response regulator
MADEITTLIVDDHEVVREGLRLSLSRAPHIRVVGEASDGESAVELALRRKPDVVIMDVRMPGMDGLSVIREARRIRPDIAVVIITGHSTEALTTTFSVANLGGLLVVYGKVRTIEQHTNSTMDKLTDAAINAPAPLGK